MSRKTLLAVIGVLTAILAFFSEEFGLNLDAQAVMAGLLVVVLYVLFEAKLDLRRFKSQAGRFKDPKFWLAFISVLLGALNEQFGLNLPAEAIIAVLTLVMSILFKVDFKKESA